MPDSDYIVVPSVSSERREYVPMGFLSRNDLSSNLVLIIPSATLFHFGVLESSVHMAWMRAVCGRLKSDYRYSKDIVYNNFPWPSCTPEYSKTVHALSLGNYVSHYSSAKTGSDTSVGDIVSHYASAKTGESESGEWKTNGTNLKMIERIERTAQAILDARALYPDASLADLYDPLTMPPELRKAHKDNDSAVLSAYGFPSSTTESEIVSLLFSLHDKRRNT